MNLPPGYTSRPGTLEDIDAVVELERVSDLAEVGFEDPGVRAYVEYEWHMSSFDVAADTRLVTGPDGSLVAYASARDEGPSGAVISALARVRPDDQARGIGGWLLRWTEERARARTTPGGRAVTLRNVVESNDRAATKLVTGEGYVLVRRYRVMQGPLGEGEPEDSPPAGIALRTLSGGDERALHEVLQAAFANHFGVEPESWDAWRADNVGAPGWDPGLIWLAWDDADAVGALYGVELEGEGLVAQIGVLPSHRGRGIATALLRQSFVEFSRRGLTKVQLTVDSMNETGATALYEKLSMTTIREFHAYDKQIAHAGGSTARTG